MPGLARGSALSMAAIAAALFVPSAASADITGTLKTPSGAPVIGESVEIRDSANNFVDFTSTNNAGEFRSPTSELDGHPAPYSLKVTGFDRCDQTGNSSREVTGSAPGDGAVVDMVLGLTMFCNGITSGPEGTAFIDPVNGLLLSPPGGTASLRVTAPSSGTNYRVTLQDGSPIGTHPDDPGNIPVTVPGAPVNVPIFLHFTASDGTAVSYQIGQLVVATPGALAPATGNLDLEAIVDVSGSMNGADPKFRRKDAVNLLLDLSARNDKLGAVGFDDDYNPIFDLTTITGDAVIKNLKSLANQKIVNEGGTNYNIGFSEAYKALTGPGVDPNRRKGAIFLTDGGHNSGAYNNGHLQFAINPSGHTWPVCVVQLGTGFQPEDVARLKRIAQETGGQYVATPTDEQLTGLYFSCLGRQTGAKTVLNKTFSFKEGQQKVSRERLPKKTLPSATFFVSWGDGEYRVQLRDPRGKLYTPRKPGRGGTYGSGETYAFFRIRRPRGGIWRMIVKALDLPESTDKANLKITVIPRKR
jgi:hypothetical protein